MAVKKARPTTRIRWALLAVVIALSVLYVGRKVNELAAHPIVEKDCGPLLPQSQTDSSKVARVEAHELAEVLPWVQKAGAINDASCLSRTLVHGIVQVTTLDDFRNALRYAQENELKISIAGVRHSMGGQAFYKDALVLDITKFNQVTIDEENRILTAQSGATWHDIQNFLHPKYAVKAMQSTDIFTVGGSISVNAHGMDHSVGALGKSVRV